ncbi:MAG: hypothetical protein ABEJ03_02245 [Candidatus Nanohaloarchaea archaeon]
MPDADEEMGLDYLDLSEEDIAALGHFYGMSLAGKQVPDAVKLFYEAEALYQRATKRVVQQGSRYGRLERDTITDIFAAAQLYDCLDPSLDEEEIRETSACAAVLNYGGLLEKTGGYERAEYGLNGRIERSLRSSENLESFLDGF